MHMLLHPSCTRTPANQPPEPGWPYLPSLLLAGFIVTLLTGAIGGATFCSSLAHAAAPASGESTATSVNEDASFLEASTVFEEPFQCLGERSPTHDEETAILRDILTEYVDQDDAESLDEFLHFTALYPDSAWRTAVLTNIGLAYRRSGYTSRALSLFQQAWETAWDIALYEEEGWPDQAAATLGSRAVGELAELYARLSRVDALEALLLEVDRDHLSGPATAQLTRASEGLSQMLNRPERAFRCGPMAVGSILARVRPEDAEARATVEATGSLSNGLPLTELARLADTIELGLQMAFRTQGAALQVPSVVHWRAHHFAAILQVQPGSEEPFYLVQDPTFGHRRWLSQRAIEEEASGYFLVPQGALPSGWRPVDEAEGNTVWGSGYTDSSDPEETSEDSEKAKMIKISRAGGDWTELTYDGFDQLIQVKEKVGTVVSDRYYIWCEGRICEERDQANTILRRFSERGYRMEGSTPTRYFYTRDHLGSIRELTNDTGALVARYDYAPYGQLTQTHGTPFSPPFGYAGYLYSAVNGLNLTRYRAYDPRIGRWLSRDPIGEAGGRNLYGYVGGDPANKRDLLGLYTELIIWEPAGIGASSFGHVSVNINGTSYSWGQNGMDGPRLVEEYFVANSFRNGTGLILNLTLADESAIEKFLANYQSGGSYDPLTRNCTSPIQEGLTLVGRSLSGKSLLPSGLHYNLLANRFVDSVVMHEPTRGNGATWYNSAPWSSWLYH